MRQQERDGGRGPLGLDIGTSRIVLARKTGDDFEFETQLNSFVTIPYARMTETALRNENVPHTVRGQEIVVHGNESARFADMLQLEARRPMTKGVLNATEPESASMMREIVATLLGPEPGLGRKVYYSIPAAQDGGESLTYHSATIGQILTSLGYAPKPINEGLAVVYGELESSNFSGIGISCGGGLCNVCMAYLSVPVVSFSTAKAGDFVDSSAAAITGDLPTRIRLTKEESFHINGHFQDKTLQVLSVYYDDMIRALIDGLAEAFSNSRNIPKLSRPVPMVLSGGSTLPKGFRERFEKMLRERKLPIALSEIRLAANPLTSTARGALIAALADA